MNLRFVFPLALTAIGCAADIRKPPPPAPSVIAVFDPLASPAPAIPLPNDLAKTGGDGVHLNVPDSPTDSPAQKDFNHYLNTLDGFPTSTPGSFSFSGPIDPTTLTVGTPTMNGSVLIFNATGNQPLGPSDYTLTASADGTSVTITPTRRWTSGDQYVVVVFGGTDPAGVRGANAETVLASPTFFFLRSPVPVEGVCGNGNTPGCGCPPDVVAKGDPNDKTCHSVITGLSDAQARQLEGPRQQVAAALGELLPFAGTGASGPRSHSDVVLFWTFTIASAPMAVFDPTRGDVPFPNDILINQTTGIVNIPFSPTDPQASIKAGLNGLDGFSTTAAETLGIDSADDIDPSTVAALKTALLLGVSSNNMPEFSAAPVFVNKGMTFAGQIAIQPTTALESDQVRYAVAVTTDVKDKSGRNLVPPPVMVLVRGKNPLVDAMGHTTVPTAVGDSDAQQLEVLRTQEKQLFDTLDTFFMIPREKVAAAWTFTTESIVRPLNALDELPTKVGLTTDVTILHIANTGDIASATLAFPSTHLGGIVTGTMTTQHASDPMTGVMAFDRTTIGADARFTAHVPTGAPAEPVRFVLTLPKTGGPWPVAIVQHGFTTWRGAMMPVADTFAAAGWATVMIDQPFHGARSICTDDSQCASGAVGSCSKTTGQCAGGLKFATPSAMDPLACTLQPLTGDANDCRPLASGAAFVNPANLFASRDNVRQYVVDAAQLIRVLSDQTNAAGLYHQLIPSGLAGFDASKLAFLGMSLGGITGSLLLSVAPQPRVAVLNVTGGHLFDIIATGSFSALLAPLLTALNVMPDTTAFLQLASTARWILDPADPIAVAQHLIRDPATSYLTSAKNDPKVILQQEDGLDTVIPPQFHEALAVEIFGGSGLDGAGHVQGHTTSGTAVSTYFPTAEHGTLIVPVPSAAVMQSEQNQAVTWISSSGATIPSP